MIRTSFLYDADDHARLARAMAKYSCSQIQAIRLGLIRLDNNPALQVKLPPRRKSDQKSKALAPATLSPHRKPGRNTQGHDGPQQA